MTRGRLAVGLFASALAVAALPVEGSAVASADPVGATGTATTVASGALQQNGLTVYKYLRSQGFTPMAAAGATTSMGGESGWNPESYVMDTNGLPSGGLMEWNGSNYQHSVGDARPTGDATADLDKQLPAIIAYLHSEVSGGQQYVDEMSSAATVMDASRIWSDHVERAGISDAHPAIAAVAARFAEQADGVTLLAGA